MTNQDMLNRADPNTIADMFRALELGDVMRAQLVQSLRAQDPVAAPASGIASTEAIVLAQSGKANTIMNAYSRAGTSTGALVVDGFTDTAPSAGHIGISPNGDLMFAPSSDTTNVDVTYLPERGDVVTYTGPVVTNALALPASMTTAGVVLLIDADALAGTSTGEKHIVLPSGSAASAGQARLDVAKANVEFASDDAVTRATVVLLIGASEGLNAFLDADAQFV